MALPGPRAFRRPRAVLDHVPSPWRQKLPPGPLCGRFAPDAALFHDGKDGELQLEAPGSGLLLAAAGFSGSYVSLALDLPDAMAADLGPGHDLRIYVTLAPAGAPLPGTAHLRLSIRDAGDPWQMTVPLDPRPGTQRVALGPGIGAPLPQRGLERSAWIDLVFSGSLHGRAIAIPALSLQRRPAPAL